ncbi:MAG: TolC family protein [Myxococcaceae bacterium]
MLLLCPQVWAQDVLTESEYVERVLEASLEAKVLEAEAALARAESVGAGVWPNPSVEWERQPNPTEDQVVGAQHVFVASIPLVLSGRLGLEADSATRGAEAGEARWTRARAELRREATLAFASVLAAAERRALLQRSLSTLQGLTRVIEAREKAGEAAGYDRTRITLERAVVEDELRAATLEERRAKRTALRLLGPGVVELPRLSGELAPKRAMPDTAVLLRELASRSDLKALKLDEESAELAKRAAARSWIPELSVTAGALLLEAAQPSARTGYVVGLGIPLPLFDRGQGPRARAEARQKLAVARYERLLRVARVELAATVDELAARRERLERHTSDVLARAEELRTITAAGYRGGSADLLALVDAERVAREAGLTAVHLTFEVNTSEAELLLIAGAYDAAGHRSPP